MKLTLTILAIFLSLEMSAQDLANQWLDSISGYTDFQEVNIEAFHSWNFEDVLSNQTRYEHDPISTYIGFFGPTFHRIDFQLKASKNDSTYAVEGRSKLGEIIRPLKGKMTLTKVFLRPQEYITDSLYIGLFNTELEEPGTSDGDGHFSGVFTIVFYKKNGKVERFSTSSGDEPNFSNTFVGHWTRFNSSVSRKVIFSFWPNGLYTQLPYCQEVYEFPKHADYSVIKEKYLQHGWKDWDNFSNRQKKEIW
jgi:hypothetical protein